jgi:hypothetical protein
LNDDKGGQSTEGFALLFFIQKFNDSKIQETPVRAKRCVSTNALPHGIPYRRGTPRLYNGGTWRRSPFGQNLQTIYFAKQ